jgi:hypothetical protein
MAKSVIEVLVDDIDDSEAVESEYDLSRSRMLAGA